MKAWLLLLFSVVSVFANYSSYEIARELKSISAKNTLDKKVLYTLAKIESGFNPLIISFTSTHTNYNFKNLKKKVSKYKNKYLISFSGKEADLQKALKNLIAKGIKVDAGLMQINSINFTEKEIQNIFKPSFNIQKSALILKQCIQNKEKLKHSIECYNKGLRKVSNFDYYEKFRMSYLRDFGGVR